MSAISHTWDANGNLLSDGAITYSYAYNGLGERVGQADGSATTSYTLDLTAPLSQVLADGKR